MAKIKCPSCGARYSGNFCPNCSAPAPERPPKKGNRILPIVVIVVVILGLLAACFGREEPPKQPSSVTPDVSSSTSGSGAVSGGSPAEVSRDVTVEEAEIFNQDGVSVTVTGFDPDDLFGPTLSVTIVNSSDQDVIVQAKNVVVNGYALNSASLYCTVAAGKSANDELQFYTSDVKACGLETFATITFDLSAIDPDTFQSLSTATSVTVTTSAPETFVQPVDDSGDVVYDRNGVRVVCKGLKEDAIWDGVVVFYVENTTDQDVYVHSTNLSVNGFMEDEAFLVDLPAGTRTVDGMSLLNMEDLALDSLDDVENIEFTLEVVKGDDWLNPDTSDPIVLNFHQES